MKVKLDGESFFSSVLLIHMTGNKVKCLKNEVHEMFSDDLASFSYIFVQYTLIHENNLPLTVKHTEALVAKLAPRVLVH